MSIFDPAVVGDAAVAVGGPTLAVGSLAAIGVLGVTDWILGDDEPPESTENADGGGSGMFEDAETAGDGGVVEGDDDEFAFDEADGGDDAFDEFDVDGMDEEGGGGGGGAQVRELETRVEELEDELSSISSTVSTVRTENEQISESVDDIEENVRKLLDIYKMVTKGVNPFVDEDGGGEMPGGQDASLGLFDQEDDADEQPENLDRDVTDADAEEFFDDDFEEDEEDVEEEEGEFDDAEADGAAPESADAEATEPDVEPDDGGEGGAKSFDELREEYEDGAEWSEDGESEDADDDADVEGRAEEAQEDEELADADPDPEADVTGEDAEDERVDGLFDEESGEARSQQPAPQPAARSRSRAPPRSEGREPVAGGAPGEKPYLRELPAGYVSDLLVMEWVEFLVSESSSEGAHRAVTYYENVGWLGRRAADQLREFVDGHPEATADESAEDAGALTMDHHTTSLRYIARITGDVQENVLASWDDGDNRWLQH